MHFTIARLLILFCVLLVSGGLLWIGLTLLMAWSILTPPRLSAGKAIYHLHRLSPGDLGLGFEEESFTVLDVRSNHKLHIAGWWIRASPMSNRCVILIHGYADAKVGSIAWAPMFNDLACNVLAIDLRAHGDSGGRFSTGGFFERDDINQVIDQIRSSRSFQTEQMILFGISLGASIACAIAERRSDIAAVILESPFPDYERVIANHVRLMNLPRGWMLKTAVAAAQKFIGARFREVRVVDLLKKIHCPVLAIVGLEDELLDADDLAGLEKGMPENTNSEFWLIENAGHLQAMAINPIEYRDRINGFITKLTPG